MSLHVPSYEVHLAIYDLSRGMARQLSAQFLGNDYAIDAIPHTGVVVYGQEYFFGAGIQSESPTLFRQMTGMMPIQLLPVGRTTVTQAEFERWCSAQMANGRYSALAYDLLQCNCNHFAHTASIEGLRLSTGVPDWVLQVPQRFLSSPMGQMVRPMLDQMQLRAPVQGAHVIANNRASSTTAVSSGVSLSQAPNPWANLNSNATTSSATGASSSASTTMTGGAKSDSSHPLLDSFVNPLLSKDEKTIALSIQKIIPTQDDSTAAFLRHCQSALVNQKQTLSLDENARMGQILYKCLQEQHVPTFVLMLLRILVVQGGQRKNTYQECLDWIRTNILQTNDNGNSSMLSNPARTMGWLVLSNATSSTLLWKDNQSEEDFWIQAGIVALHESEIPIRQAAAAFLYNVSLQLPNNSDHSEGLSDTSISLLCATLEGLVTEMDDSTRLRRLMTAGRVIVPPNQGPSAAAMELVVNLGLQQSIMEQESTVSSTSGDAAKCQKLAAELNNIISIFSDGLVG